MRKCTIPETPVPEDNATSGLGPFNKYGVRLIGSAVCENELDLSEGQMLTITDRITERHLGTIGAQLQTIL